MTDSAPLLHLALIPDGNRRWAKLRMLLPWNGHERAIENFKGLIDWCRKSGRIGTLTIWCFSTENWKRDPKEIDELMKLFEKYLKDERKKFAEDNVRFFHSGRRDRLPASLVSLIGDIEDETKENDGFTVHLAIDYGGKNALVRALGKLKNPAQATEEDIRAAVDHPEVPDIDLIIRTSGEQRTSNFFLWESAYAEWIFLTKHFPELTNDDLRDGIAEFDKRKRRFGS